VKTKAKAAPVKKATPEPKKAAKKDESSDDSDSDSEDEKPAKKAPAKQAAGRLVLTNASNAGDRESPSMRIRAWTKLCDAFDQSVALAPHYFVPEFQRLIEEEFSKNEFINKEEHAALLQSAPDFVVRILPSSVVSFVGYRR